MERFDWLEIGKAPEKRDGAGERSFDARHYLNEAERAYRNGAYEFALKSYARALREDAGLWEGWVGQVNCLRELGEFHEARTWANKALERIPESAQLLGAKALVLSRMGEGAEALALSDRAVAKRDPEPAVWLFRGLTLLFLRPPGNAAYCFLKAVEGAPKDGFTPLRIGMAYLELGHPPKARAYLDQALEQDSANPLAWHAAGRCFEGLFAIGRALTCYERALALNPEFKSRVIDDLARIAKRGFWDRLSAWVKGGRS